LKLACGVSTNVLILVNSNALLEQWKERIEKNTEARCFHWNSLHGSTGRFTIATIQYVSQRCWRERWELGAAHGMLIVDECHRLPAHTFAPTVAALPCKIRLGLTATPRRSDGLGAWVNHLLGPTAFKYSTLDTMESGVTLRPTIEKIKTDISPRGWNRVARITNLTKSARRNEFILKIAQKRMNAGGSVLVICARVEHCKALAKAAGAVCVHGSTPKKKREGIFDDVRAGRTRLLFATNIADEGLDLPRLDTLILSDPTGNQERTEQRVGRIMRHHPDKLPPRVFDFIDDHPEFHSAHRNRLRLYKRCKWPIYPPPSPSLPLEFPCSISTKSSLSL
tara:strand:+ start:555 stop:1565 length:1011 start_codon:yes stop_codon:yes gene_type:complete